MPGEQTGDEHHERFVAGQRRGFACDDARMQPTDGGREPRVAHGRMGKLDAAEAFFRGDARDQRGREVQHPPAPAGAGLERRAVVHLAGIDHDRVTRQRVDLPATAPRPVRTADDHAHPEFVVRVARKRAVGFEAERLDAFAGASIVGDTVHVRSSRRSRRGSRAL
ncbi:hypothetical protein P355_1619 [Burkholderia cenocepacia KC-01]|nr:hypothetical protein P355_1619 [Burkholderia cenocepacia KC-01]